MNHLSPELATRSNEKVSIEEYREGHAKELVRMWRESFEFGVGITDPHPLEEQERALLELVVPNNAVRVAFLDGRMVGFIAASPTSIAQLYVRKGFEGRGIGSQLLDWAKRQSAGSLWLYTFERNLRARAFYEHHGFRIVARGHEPVWQLDDLRYEWAETVVETEMSSITSDAAKRFAAALDADDYPALTGLLAEGCQYVTSKGTFIGAQAILDSYRDASTWTKSHIQHVEYESVVRLRDERSAVVTFIDRFEHAGLAHEYACEQELTVDSHGRICGIVHRELPGRREAVDAFLEAAGIKGRP